MKQGEQRQRLVIPDSSGKKNDIIADINWNKAVRLKYIRFTLGGKRCIIKKDHLLSILFMLGNAKEQDQLISPFVKQTQITKFTKMIGITTTRDVRKGEMINVLLDFSFNPETNKIIIGKGSKSGLMSKKG